MSLDPEFLQMLVCPATRKPLREVTADEIAALNARIAGGDVVNRAGQPVTATLEAGLQPDGEMFVYPIQDGIPILLTTEAIAMGPAAGAAPAPRPAAGGEEPS